MNAALRGAHSGKSLDRSNKPKRLWIFTFSRALAMGTPWAGLKRGFGNFDKPSKGDVCAWGAHSLGRHLSLCPGPSDHCTARVFPAPRRRWDGSEPVKDSVEYFRGRAKTAVRSLEKRIRFGSLFPRPPGTHGPCAPIRPDGDKPESKRIKLPMARSGLWAGLIGPGTG